MKKKNDCLEFMIYLFIYFPKDKFGIYGQMLHFFTVHSSLIVISQT